MKLLADENIPGLERYFDGGVELRRAAGRHIHRDMLNDVDILLVRSVTRVDQELLAESSVRFVGSATSGFDHIDTNYLKAQDIGFVYAPGSNANSVVEYVLAAIASVEDVLEQVLSGAEIGIVGYGHVGRCFARRLAALGVASRIYDPWLDQDSIPQAASLAEVLRCRVVSLHPELTHREPWPSYHLLGAEELAQLEAQTLLINASRGSVLDNNALLSQLSGTNPPRVVLDVWEGEPGINTELLDRVEIGTPHIAGYSWDGKLKATQMLAEAVTKHFDLSAPNETRPVDGADVIRLSGSFSPAGLVRHLLAARYDIRSDDATFRQAATTADVAAEFDRLRRNYPRRRELVNSVVQWDGVDETEAEVLRSLGCIPQSADQAS